MTKFVRMIDFTSKSGGFDTEGDSEDVNEILSQLQEKGAEILDIKGSVSRAQSQSSDDSTNIVYIVYEAESPIEVEESGGFF